MLHRYSLLLTVLFCSAQLNAGSLLKNVQLQDLYFGEVLYYAYQDRYFEALTKLDSELTQYYHVDEPTRDSLNHHIGQAEFSVGDIELQYRMNKRAGKALQAVLGKDLDLATRNQIGLKLAKVFYRKNEDENTLHALDLIRNDLKLEKISNSNLSEAQLFGNETQRFKNEVNYMRALANIKLGHYENAIKDLQNLTHVKSLSGYVQYNLALALKLAGKEEQSVEVQDELGQMDFDQDEQQAVRDKANLKLAYYYLDKENAKQAKKYFDRVRLKGPYSNHALLGSGWSSVAQSEYDRALVPWSILHQREVTDSSVQEALMAVPYAYSKLGVHGKAANLYKHAMDTFGQQIDRLDDSISAVRDGRFLKELLNIKSKKDKNWVVNLREMPDAPETRYLLDLMASHEFQESYLNYRDLAEMRKHTKKWLGTLKTFEEIIVIRKNYYEPLLPTIEEKFKKVDSRINLRLEQRKNISRKLKNILIVPKPEFLTTSTERQALDVVAKLSVTNKNNSASTNNALAQRLSRLKGYIHWKTTSEYDERLTDAYNNRKALDEKIEKLNINYRSFVRTRQAATQSYLGYNQTINKLRARLLMAEKNINKIMDKQGRLIEDLANDELLRRLQHLEHYQVKARFALAESYDRATKAKVDKEINKRKKLKQSLEQKQAEELAVQAKKNPVKDKEKETHSYIAGEQTPERTPEKTNATPSNKLEPSKK